jgi:formylglycine-generating enzyme required for sulfatase activity
MVTPAATTTYTLTASGLVPVTRSVTIGMIGMAYAKDNIVGNMMLVPAGTFTQGSPTSEVGRDDNETQFTHTLTLNLAVMETAVTRQMWADLKAADSSMPSDPTVTSRGSGMNNPVQRVTWYEAILFANLLSKKAGLTQAYSLYGSTVDASNYQSDSIDCNFRASGYRLPTEGEREYFTRAGSTTPFSINEPAYDWNTCSSCTKGALPALESVAWFCATAGETSHPVGEKAANGWGLIDIHGNVDEWCWDWEASYPGGLQTDYRGPSSGLDRVRRGGSWSSSPQGVRSAFRLRYKPGYRYLDGLGFRLVRSLP